MKTKNQICPKLRSNFSVSIDTGHDELVNSYTIIEKQVVSFDLGVENLSVPMLAHAKGSVVIWLEDDNAGQLMTALRKCQRVQDTFNITLNLFDDKETVTEQYTFGQCRMSALQHSIFSYESSTDAIRLWRVGDTSTEILSGSEQRGTLKASTSRDHVMKLLQVEFIHYGHKIIAQCD